MKKFLLVTMIGLVLAINLCGIVKQIVVKDAEEIDHIDATTITVYVE